MEHVCFYVCCSDCVGVCGNVCCVAVVVENSVFSLGVLKYVVCSGCDGCCVRKQDPASPRLSTMNDEITKATSDHKRRQWREFVENIDHRTDNTKWWRTIKGIDGKSKQTEENEGITFTGRPHTSPKMIANSFNLQFTTSKLGKHS